MALVIGNGNYLGQPHLFNPSHDAEDMTQALQALGFKVIQGTDVNKAGFDAKLHEFSRGTSGADVAFFFYSGHGMQINGVNYLMPVDAPVAKEDLEFQTVTIDFVQKVLERAKTKIVMLDACRNNPFAAVLGQNLGTRAVNANSGLAMTTAPDLGYFIAFATQPGHVASDGAGRNSPFTASLKTHMDTAGLSISDLMIVVRNEVVQATAGQQNPLGPLGAVLALLFQGGRKRGGRRRRSKPEILRGGGGLGLGARHFEPGSLAAVHHDLRGLHACLAGKNQAGQPETVPGTKPHNQRSGHWLDAGDARLQRAGPALQSQLRLPQAPFRCRGDDLQQPRAFAPR